MKWLGGEESSNVEDRRGFGGKGIMLGGGGGLIALLIALFLGIDPGRLNPGGGGQSAAPAPRAAPADPAEERLASFSKIIFRDTEVVWDEQFRALGREYRKPTLVLYSGLTRSGCGMAQAAVGPFYCARDGKIYLDLAFFSEMERKLDAPGDLARAYVIAHEVGHHVQRLLGITPRGQSSVPMELQADFIAGVWAHHAQEKFSFLEEGDLQSALNAAYQIGDDRLQKRSQGFVVPDSFTHGSSAQRERAFRDGFESGDVRLARRYDAVGALGE